MSQVQQSTKLFLESCQRKMEQSMAMHHPFLTEFEGRHLSHEQLNRFAIQWYKTARGHKRAFPALVYNVRDDDVRFELIDILREEYGNGDREKIHARLLQNFLRALGISEDQVAATPTLPEVSIFSDQVMEIWRDDNEVRAFGLHFALEFLASALHVHFAQGLKKYDFLKEVDREYFDYHSIAEQRHADYSSLGLERYAELESNRALLNEGVDTAIRLMNQLWSGFRFAHLELNIKTVVNFQSLTSSLFFYFMNLDESLEGDLIILARIYPNLTRDQLLEAKENLDRYFDLAVRIWRRLEKEEFESVEDFGD